MNYGPPPPPRKVDIYPKFGFAYKSWLGTCASPQGFPGLKSLTQGYDLHKGGSSRKGVGPLCDWMIRNESVCVCGCKYKLLFVIFLAGEAVIMPPRGRPETWTWKTQSPSLLIFLVSSLNWQFFGPARHHLRNASLQRKGSGFGTGWMRVVSVRQQC